MSSSTDIEAQNEISQEFNHESKLRRLKSAGAVTISPELFEKVFFLVDDGLLMVVVRPAQIPCCRRLSSKIRESNAIGLHGVYCTPYGLELIQDSPLQLLLSPSSSWDGEEQLVSPP